MDLPNVRCRATPVAAEAVIWSVGLASRIQELMDIRRRHVDLQLGSVWISGTKTKSATAAHDHHRQLPSAEGIDGRLLKVLIGHGDPLGGITSKYLSPELFLQLVLEIQPGVRRHLAQLPSQEGVVTMSAELLAGMRAERRARRRAGQ